jgi:hypothetical protein
MKYLSVIAVLLVVGYGLADDGGLFAGDATRPIEAVADGNAALARDHDCDALARAYRNHFSHVEVRCEGVVAKVLKEDDEGSRHQRFIVRLPWGPTVLIAHNIDLAPCVEGLHPGAPIEFAGEYEWNARGGVVHWTHRDPSGRHAPGWIRYEGRFYQ